MKKTLFLCGLLIIVFALFLRLSSSPSDFYNMTFGEFATLVLIGCLMILPKLISYVRQFFTSGRSEERRF